MSMKGANNVVFQIVCLSAFCCIFRPASCASGNTSSVVKSLVPGVSISVNVSQFSIVTPSLSYSASTTHNKTILPSSTTINATSTSPSSIKTPTLNPTTQGIKDEGRKFDGLSFFGGMILGSTICVLLFFALKYYRAKKLSYHSL